MPQVMSKRRHMECSVAGTRGASQGIDATGVIEPGREMEVETASRQAHLRARRQIVCEMAVYRAAAKSSRRGVPRRRADQGTFAVAAHCVGAAAAPKRRLAQRTWAILVRVNDLHINVCLRRMGLGAHSCEGGASRPRLLRYCRGISSPTKPSLKIRFRTRWRSSIRRRVWVSRCSRLVSSSPCSS